MTSSFVTRIDPGYRADDRNERKIKRETPEYKDDDDNDDDNDDDDDDNDDDDDMIMMIMMMMMISLSRWRAIRSRVHSTYAILEFIRFSILNSIVVANFSLIFVYTRSKRFFTSCISRILCGECT